jgi:hypothetical protein
MCSTHVRSSLFLNELYRVKHAKVTEFFAWIRPFGRVFRPRIDIPVAEHGCTRSPCLICAYYKYPQAEMPSVSDKIGCESLSVLIGLSRRDYLICVTLSACFAQNYGVEARLECCRVNIPWVHSGDRCGAIRLGFWRGPTGSTTPHRTCLVKAPTVQITMN